MHGKLETNCGYLLIKLDWKVNLQGFRVQLL